MKTIIIPADEIGCLAQAMAVQEADIRLSKDPKSAFYFAMVDDKSIIPSDLHTLDYQGKSAEEAQIDDDKSKKNELIRHVDELLDKLPQMENTLDIRMRFHLPENVDRKSFESALQSGIGELVRGIITKHENDEEQE